MHSHPHPLTKNLHDKMGHERWFLEGKEWNFTYITFYRSTTENACSWSSWIPYNWDGLSHLHIFEWYLEQGAMWLTHVSTLRSRAPHKFLEHTQNNKRSEKSQNLFSTLWAFTLMTTLGLYWAWNPHNTMTT
jgi:hypothetical protein